MPKNVLAKFKEETIGRNGIFMEQTNLELHTTDKLV